MIDVAEALDLIAAHAAPLDIETVALSAARGRRLATRVDAPIDLPPFDNSAMDGYALRAEDVTSATEATPVSLPVIDTIAAGTTEERALQPNTAMRIMTGAPVPDGADSVLQLEHGRLRDDHVEVRAPLTLGRHVRMRGEDVQAGDALAEAGTLLSTNHMALLANAGIAQVATYRPARVSILATGRELVQPSETATLAPGQIYDSNGPVMRAMAADVGCDVTDLGTVEDDADAIRAAISRGLDGDVIMISGGVSVGKYDHVKDVLADLGMERLFWRVRMKPGKPLLCGRIGSTWIFGLPGNPISCVAGFTMFIAPLLRVMHGAPTFAPLLHQARLTHEFTHDGSRLVLATADIARATNGMLEVTPTRQQGSAMMHALAGANGFVVVPDTATTLKKDAMVDVIYTP